ncbi:ATP-binding protein [Streptomyces echinatus]|uniref:ATP-binding protein n=1 Tax=Streptomyces echinatus TaxID=67293 RepID=UPI0037BE17B8
MSWSTCPRARVRHGGDASAAVPTPPRCAVAWSTDAVHARTRTRHQACPVSQRAMDLAQLVVGELVSNARKYAPGPVLLDLRVLGGLVEIVVWDSDPVLPIARAADAGRVGQHGLEIVMAVAQGFEAHREPVGKRITARLALADDPGGAIPGRPPL